VVDDSRRRADPATTTALDSDAISLPVTSCTLHVTMSSLCSCKWRSLDSLSISIHPFARKRRRAPSSAGGRLAWKCT
jgi:hypothetical protein